MLNAGDRWSYDWTTFSPRVLVETYCSERTSVEAKEDAFAAIYQRYHAELFRLIVARIANRPAGVDLYADAQDIHAEVWRCVCRKLPTFVWCDDGVANDPLKAWLMSIAMHKIQEFYYGAHPHVISLTDEQTQTLAALAAQAPLEEQRALSEKMRLRVQKQIRKAMSCLGPTEQQVIRLTYFAGKNATEIGALLTLSPQNVRVIRHRAIERMRKFLTSGGANA